MAKPSITQPRVGMSSTTEYQRIGGMVAHWLTQRNVTILIGIPSQDEDNEVQGEA